MATTTTSTFTALGGKLVVDDDLGGTDNTVSDNVTGATSGKIFVVQIDNTLNTSSLYLKIRDASSATPSTSTANGAGTPHLMFYAPSGKTTSYVIPEGHAYAAGVSMWCTTSAVAGTEVEPPEDVTVTLICS